MGCCGPAVGHTVVARGWQWGDRKVVPLWGKEWGKRWGGMGLGGSGCCTHIPLSPSGLSRAHSCR